LSDVTANSRQFVQRIDHIGVVVSDLEEGRRWLGDIMGLPAHGSIELREGQIRGELYGCGDVDIEVIEIGDPDVRRRRLGEHRRARIEHIAVVVDDLHAVLGRLAPLGVRITTPEPLQDGNDLTAWTVEETTGGISYQFIQRNA
jgi:methylmalonyl-CoA/ethylmalonyl-CoA epimerase